MEQVIQIRFQILYQKLLHTDLVIQRELVKVRQLVRMKAIAEEGALVQL